MRSCLNTNSDSILSRFRAGRKDLLGPGLNPSLARPRRSFLPLLESVRPPETLLLRLWHHLQMLLHFLHLLQHLLRPLHEVGERRPEPLLRSRP